GGESAGGFREQLSNGSEGNPDGFWRQYHVHRTFCGASQTHRVPDPGGFLRKCDSPGGTGLLDPEEPPENDRGSAFHRPDRGTAPEDGGGGGPGCEGGRI